MKNRKIIAAVTLLSILATTNVQALTNNQVCTYTEAYKEYMKLSKSEKKKYNEPIMCVSQRITSPSKLLKGSLPSSYNTYGGVIKNQQTTDTCWAFSTTSVLESFLHTHMNLDKVFSPTHMDYMLSQSFTNINSNPYGYNRQVNTGGNFYMAANYMINQYGPVLESRVPFELNPGNVNSSSIIGLTPQVDVNGAEVTLLDEITGVCTPALVDIMKNAVYTTGPIAVTMNRDDSYLNSSNGAYVNLSTPMQSNHAVMIIGWDDSYSKENFNEGNRPSENGAFIAQNSYGTNYGNNGIMYISYEDTSLCSQYFAVRDVDATLEDNKYSYDELGTSSGELPTTAVMAIYEKKTNGIEQIKEVTFATAEPGNYEIYLYRGNAKKENILITEMENIGTGRISYSGYQTHKLTSDVYIAPTTPVYSIVVKQTADNKDNRIPVALKHNIPREAETINSNIVIEPGKTYAYTGLWEDLYYYLEDDDIRMEASIKVFTNNVSVDYLELAAPTVQYNDTSANLNFVTSDKNYSKVKSIEVTNPNGKSAVVQSYHENTSNGKYTSLDVVLAKNGDLVTGRYNLTLTLEDNSTTTIGFDLSPVVISNLYIDADIVQVLVGGKTQVKYHFDGENVEQYTKKVTFSSEDESIATVDEYGVVTALAYGMVRITVTDEFGNSDTCTIEIEENWAEGTEISPKSATWIRPNTTLQLTQNLGSDLDWHSSDESVLIVDNTGKVTAVSEGVAVISILIDGWIIDSYELKVSDSEPFNPLNITITDTRTSYISGKIYDFDFTCDKSSCLSLVEITSSNTQVATITSDGKINALKPGTTTIKVKDLNSDTYKTKQITVTYPLSNVSITNQNFSINKGSTLQTTINYTKNVYDSITEANYIKYSSSDTSVATISSTGLITGIKGGTATIYVKDNYGSILAQKSLTVIERTITLNESNQTIIMGNNKTLNYTCNYSDLATCTNQLIWTSSNTDVATVNNGVVTAIKPGTTIIKVADKTDTNLYKQFTLTVGYTFNSLNITTPNSTLLVGSNKTIEVSYDYVGNNTPSSELTWTSSNTNVATVNNGIVTALNKGTTTITVSDPLNKYPKSIEITVVNEIEDFRITTGNKTILSEETTTISYEGNYYGTSTLENSITWNSTNKEVATVNNGLVTPVGIGTTTIEIYSKQNVLLGTVDITVNYVFNSLTINNTNTKIVKGTTSTLDLSYGYIGKNTNPISLLTFTSEDTNVATVDENGIITALNKGTTTITVSDPLNKYATSLEFTVVDEINSFNITTEATSFYYDDELELTYECEYYGSNTCQESINWISSDNSVARVTNGIIKGILPGTVTIKATDKLGNVLAQKTLQVLYPYTEITLGSNNSNILIGSEVQFNASTTYEGTKTPVLVYTSSNPEIISIDRETGLMTAMKIGTSNIEVSDPLGQYTKSFEITVKNTIENFSITNDEQVLLSDEELEIRYTADYYGNKTLDQEVYFEIDNEDIAIIIDGKVLPISSGIVTINAYDLNNNLLDSYELEVKNAFDNISLKENNYTVVLGNTSKMELLYDYLGINTNPEELIIYESITPEIATIDKDGNINTLKKGTAIFKATLGFAEIELTITVVNEIENFEITNINTNIVENTNLLITYTGTYYGNNSLEESIKFVSTNEEIATVDENGVVTPNKPGTTTIQIYDLNDNLLDEIEINVVKEISEFKITNENSTITNEDTLKITYTGIYTGPNTLEESIKFVSTNEDIATVDENGVVTPHKLGKTTIQIYDLNDNLLDEIEVTIEYSLKELNASVKNDRVVEGSNTTIDIEIDYTGKIQDIYSLLTFESSDEEIATVNSVGIVTTKKSGTVTITISDNLKVYTKTVTITVVKEIEDFKFTSTKHEVEHKKTLNIEYEAIYNGTNTLEESLVWTSSNNEIATVENGLVTTHKPGIVTINVYNKDNELLGTYEITITYEFKSLTITEERDTIKKGESKILDVEVIYTGEESNPYSLLTYTSSNPNILSIDENGLMTANKMGTVTITVSDPLGLLTKTFDIKVTIIYEGFKLTTGNQTSYVGKTIEIGYVCQFNGEETCEDNLIWTSSNNEIATVENGIVKSLKPGIVTITVTNSDGDFSENVELEFISPILELAFKEDSKIVYINRMESIEYICRMGTIEDCNKYINYDSSNESVLKVVNGKYVGLHKGMVYLTLKDIFGQFIVRQQVTVENSNNDEKDYLVLYPTQEQLKSNVCDQLENISCTDDMIWTSSNTDVLEIIDDRIIANTIGTTLLTLSDPDNTYNIYLNVYIVDGYDSIDIIKETMKINIDKEEYIEYSFMASNPVSSKYDLIWTSSDETVATVDENGKIKGLKPGITTIRVEDIFGLISDSIEITVVDYLEELKLLDIKGTIIPNNEYPLDYDYIYTGKDNIEDHLVFTSSNEDIATIEDRKLITHGVGTVTITLADDKEQFTSSKEIEVINPITYLTASVMKNKMFAGTSQTYQINCETISTDGFMKYLKITSSDETVATVSGTTIKALKEGTTTITVEDLYGTYNSSFEITVEYEIPKVELIDKSIETTMTLSGKVNHKVICETVACTKSIRFYVDDEDILSINELTGEYTGLLFGKTNIRIKDINNLIEIVIPVTVNSEITSITYDNNATTIKVNETTKVNFVVEGIDNEKDYSDKVVITSSDENIATIEDGIVRPIKPGTITITIKDIYNSNTVSYDLEIKNVIETLNINDLNDKYLDNEEIDLGVNINGTNDDLYDYLIFTSSDETVATITDRGIINTHVAGTVTITVKDIYNTLIKTITITVERPITNIELNASEITLFEGKTFDIETTIYPENATIDKTLTYTSLDSSVATVEDGVITAIKEGTTTIEVETVNGIKETITVKVVGVSNIIFKLNGKDVTSVSIGKGGTATLTAITNSTFEEENKRITYRSSNASIVSIDSTGKITALKGGRAYIYATASNGFEKSILVSVSAPITSVTLNRTTLSLEYAKTYRLSATINPSDTTQSKTLTWTSSNTAIATVNSVGLITAKKIGTAVITVKTSNGKTAKCTVTVTKVNPSSLTVKAIANYTYSGAYKKPLPVVTYNGVTLKKGTHYTLSYSNNKYPGKATVTIKMKSSALYNAGNRVVYFKIVPKKVTIYTPSTKSGSVTAKWAKHTGVSGYEVQFKLKGTTTWQTFTSTGTSYKKTGLIKGKYYYIRVRAYKIIDGVKYYGSFSTTKTVKCK